MEQIPVTSSVVLKSFLLALYRRLKNNENVTHKLLLAWSALNSPSSLISETQNSRKEMILLIQRRQVLLDRASGLLLKKLIELAGPSLILLLKHFKPVRLTTNKPFQSS